MQLPATSKLHIGFKHLKGAFLWQFPCCLIARSPLAELSEALNQLSVAWLLDFHVNSALI